MLVIPALIFPLELIRVWRETNHKTLKTNRVERERDDEHPKKIKNKQMERRNERASLEGPGERGRGTMEAKKPLIDWI